MEERGGGNHNYKSSNFRLHALALGRFATLIQDDKHKQTQLMAFQSERTATEAEDKGEHHAASLCPAEVWTQLTRRISTTTGPAVECVCVGMCGGWGGGGMVITEKREG